MEGKQVAVLAPHPLVLAQQHFETFSGPTNVRLSDPDRDAEPGSGSPAEQKKVLQQLLLEGGVDICYRGRNRLIFPAMFVYKGPRPGCDRRRTTLSGRSA